MISTLVAWIGHRSRVRVATAALSAAVLVTSAGAQELLIGQSAALTGPGSIVGKQVAEGVQAYFDAVNAKGGVHGRKLKLISLDDGGKDDAALANTRTLAGQQVQALVAYTRRNTTAAALPALDEFKLPLVGPTTGGVHEKFHPWLFNTRASYRQEVEALVKYEVEVNRGRNVALVFLDDDPRRVYETLVKETLAKLNLKLNTSIAIKRDSEDLAAVVQQLGRDHADAVIAIVTPKSMKALVSAMRVAKINPRVSSYSFYASDIVDLLGVEAAGMVFAQVVPTPKKESAGAAIEYRRALAKSFPKAEPSSNGLEGFIAAMTLVEGLKRAGRAPTGKRIAEALESLTAFDTGAYPLSFSATNHNGSSYVSMAIVGRQGKLRE